MSQKRLPEMEIFFGDNVDLIARITEMHAHYYSAAVGFGPVFESIVAAGLAEFSERLDNPRNGIWTVRSGEKILGSVAIDSNDLEHGDAHLRWFIVDSSLRGTGYGKRLLDTALAFVDTKNFAQTYLWTFSGLNTARYLYENRGFLLKNERKGSQWGSEVLEQYFVRYHPDL
ncbi:GNAT family N-acetyltransferase [Pectobacterium aroidearum]|uniref:GNAT family N-acetyltransferase n=1 Tax=Pectobacterium aroidearum TaxID=1201031 RepID=A0AAW3SSK0_9GAMM|nr:GNAT family N-acetyltransferase [Pectobacterium aroidearum]MBA5202558.1 GNAT family N-acetyltransferase [Pectobacterium aroidearum]